MNERITENIVRKYLTKLGYYKNKNIIVEEQKSEDPKINKLLSVASKKGTKGGHPEFIISNTNHPELIIIIECKSDVKKHESMKRDKYSTYAVDGALLYASFLSKQYDVITIGVSGQNSKELKISQFLYLKSSNKYDKFVGDKILSFNNYFNTYIKDERKLKQNYDSLLEYPKELNNKLHSLDIPESYRCLLISGILIALKNKAFRLSYSAENTASDLADALLQAVINELKSQSLKGEKLANIKGVYSTITRHRALTKNKKVIIDLIQEIEEKIGLFLKTHKYYDYISKFYVEFLRYANNEKGLGIVLTPIHITELFVKLANINKDSFVLDNCCGTAGFLISSLRYMIEDAKGDEVNEKHIKNFQLVGIESQPHIYTLAISNMVLHDDGKSSIQYDSCFDVVNKIKNKFKPTVGLLNPPYTKNELKFILNNLEMLQPNSVCVAILPISCVIAPKKELYKLKEIILKNHTLEAVISMPNELFYDSDAHVVTVALILTAHKPHQKKTWFAYWKDDGYIKTKHKGRIDGGKWNTIEKKWVDMYLNRKTIKGVSLLKKVNAEDEWCVEAYLKTDYSTLNKDNFITTLRKYAIFNLLNKEYENPST